MSDLTPFTRCESASPEVICMSPAQYRVTMHPPKVPGDLRCGHHVTLLCKSCVEVIALHVQRSITAAVRGRGPQPICPICQKPFREVHDVMSEVERL